MLGGVRGPLLWKLRQSVLWGSCKGTGGPQGGSWGAAYHRGVACRGSGAGRRAGGRQQRAESPGSSLCGEREDASEEEMGSIRLHGASRGSVET